MVLARSLLTVSGIRVAESGLGVAVAAPWLAGPSRLTVKFTREAIGWINSLID